MDTPAAPPQFDLRDWIIIILVPSGFIAAWTYVFIHPSEGVYIACIGFQGTFASILHALSVFDDKLPDNKNGA